MEKFKLAVKLAVRNYMNNKYKYEGCMVDTKQILSDYVREQLSFYLKRNAEIAALNESIRNKSNIN